MIASVRTTLRDWFHRTYLGFRLSCGTDAAEQYRIAIGLLERYLQRSAVLDDLNAETIARWLRWLLEERKLRPATVRSKRQAIVTLWRFAWERKAVAEPPLGVPPIALPDQDPASWTTEELDRLLTAARGWKLQRYGHRSASLLWTPRHFEGLFRVLYDTGERIGALMQVPASAYRPATGSLFVAAEYRKARCKPRHYALKRETCEVLDGLPPFDRLFPWRGHVNGLRRHLNRLLIEAGLPHDRWSKFHRFRRTTATLIAAEQGMQAAREALGHSSEAVTRRSYVSQQNLPPSRWCDVLPDLRSVDPRQGKLFD